MNTLIEIIMNDSNTNETGVVVIRYYSNAHGKGKKIHTEFFAVDEIFRISLNGYSMTIHWNRLKVGLVLMIRDDFELEKISDFIDMKYPGKGLKVIQHFARLTST